MYDRVRVLTWNLKHGRSVPSAGHSLFDEFASALAGWEWDVALLQEVPPWWPAPLAARTGAGSERHVLTSRNWGLPVRRAIAERRPDLIKSNGGGCNAILARTAIAEHRTRRLSLLPERRWVHAVRLDGPDVWVANLHLQGTVAQAQAAASTTREWAGDAPLVLGGDFNLRSLDLPDFEYAGGHDVDHVLARGLAPAGAAEVLDRGRLSDHAPVAVTVTPAGTPGCAPARRSPEGRSPPSRR